MLETDHLPKPHAQPLHAPFHFHLHNPLNPFDPHHVQNPVYFVDSSVVYPLDLRDLLG
jgi:hypothetical protein